MAIRWPATVTELDTQTLTKKDQLTLRVAKHGATPHLPKENTGLLMGGGGRLSVSLLEYKI